MESAVAVGRSFPCAVGKIAHVKASHERSSVIPMCNGMKTKMSFKQSLKVGRYVSSPFSGKGKSIKASENTSMATSDVVSSKGSLEGPPQKENMRPTIFPSGFESLVLGICDETEVAEVKLKCGDFEMLLRRQVGATKAHTSIVSPSEPPPVPSKPMVESVASAPAAPPKDSKETATPFKNVSFAKSPKLEALEASGANGFVLVSSPTVGSFRRGRTVKGKKQPPICKEGDVIKEGQTIGYVDQFGSELPVKSDAAGEILKLLYDDGDAVGYGDPLVAVLPSFHGIQ